MLCAVTFLYAEGISTKKFFNIEDTSLKGFDAKLQICSRVDTFFWLLKLYKGKYVLIDMRHNPKLFGTNKQVSHVVNHFMLPLFEVGSFSQYPCKMT